MWLKILLLLLVTLIALGTIFGVPWVTQKPWISIGYFELEEFSDLSTAAMPEFATITPDSLIDSNSHLVADPFLFVDDDQQFIFFEMLKDAGGGKIGASALKPDGSWEYLGSVLDEKFHLSYPLVFEHSGERFMVPESWQANSVRLYRANDFPRGWQFVSTLIEGEAFIDPTVFRHNQSWWLLVSLKGNKEIKGNKELRLYMADELTGPWEQHPQSPVVVNDPNIARPGGRMIKVGERLYRVGQDTFPQYGLAVGLFEITTLNREEYVEVAHPDNPILRGSGDGWNADGMHHLDLQQVDGRWLGVADGHYETLIFGP